MKGIFYGATFGDKFKTEDGRRALLVGRGQFGESVLLYIQEGGMEFYGEARYSLDGTALDKGAPNIVNRWKESINEDELDRLANVYYPDCEEFGEYERLWVKVNRSHERNCFKVGYRKAKEE